MKMKAEKYSHEHDEQGWLEKQKWKQQEHEAKMKMKAEKYSHEYDEQGWLEKQKWKQQEHEAKLERKAEKYSHKYDPHPVFVHRDIHHHYETPHT